MISSNDLTGKTFGRWTVLHQVKRPPNPNRIGKRRSTPSVWACICACGSEHFVLGYTLRNGSSLSCGCLQRTHTMTGSRMYRIWSNMKRRCYNSTNPMYKYYGGRGIKVCDRWLHSFENFLSDVGFLPSPELSLDRIDPDGDYCLENCRWADAKTQSQNRRNVKLPGFNQTDWPYGHSCVLRLMREGLDRAAIIKHAEDRVADTSKRIYHRNTITKRLQNIKESKHYQQQ